MSDVGTISHDVMAGAGPAATWSLLPAPLVVDEVKHISEAGEGFVRAHLDAPLAGQNGDTYSLTIQGWAVGRSARTRGIEILGPGGVHARAAVDRPRPDVVSYLGEGTPPDAGFAVAISLLGLPEEFELRVQAVLEDGVRQPFAVVRGRVHLAPLPAPEPPHPLLMVTLGRTGSTWLTRLLGCHPSVIAYKPFAYEPRVLTYWAKVVLALGDPRSYLQTLAARLTTERWWLGDDALPSLPRPDAAVAAVLGQSGIEAQAEFARTQIRAVYGAIAAVENRCGADIFTEKVAPERSVLEMADWLYPGHKRLYLVRDPRDMALSILSYNARNGLPGFGSERVGSRDAFLDEVAQSIANMLELFRSDPAVPMLVRYEDLITDPHREMSRIFGGVGVDASPTTVAEVVSAASQPLPGMDQHRTSASMPASVGRWREELGGDQRALWTEKFADVLRDCGYTLDEGN